MTKAKYVIIGVVAGILTVIMGLEILFQYTKYDKEVSRIENFYNKYNDTFQNNDYDIKSTSISDANKKVIAISNKLSVTLSVLPDKKESHKFVSSLKNISKVSGLVIDVINIEASEHEFYNEHLITITLSGSEEHFNKFGNLVNSIKPVHSWENCSVIDNNLHPLTIYCDIATYYRMAEDFTKTNSRRILFPPKKTEAWLPLLSSHIQSMLLKANKFKKDIIKYENEIRVFRTYIQIKNQQTYAEAIVNELSKDRKSFNESYKQIN